MAASQGLNAWGRGRLVRGAVLLPALVALVACEPTSAQPGGPGRQPTPQPAPQPTPQPAPQEPAPASPKPEEPKPDEPKPEEPKPNEPAPAQQPPTRPRPSEDPMTTPTGRTPDPWPPPANPSLPTMPVTIGGKRFALEKALNDETRFKGMSGRRDIAATGGMIFLFRDPQQLAFVMRDCPIPIDIIYLDASARITAMYNMQPEPPRAADEKPLADARLPAWAWTNPKYEARLKRYPSRGSAVIAIELRGGTLNINGSNPSGITLKVGDKIEGLDVPALRREAR